MLNLTELQNNLNTKRGHMLIIGALLVLLIIIIVLLAKLGQQNSTDTGSLSPTPISSYQWELTPVPSDYYDLPTPLPNETVPTTPPTPVPQPGDIILHGVAVNNFRANAVRITETGGVILAENNQYQIVYFESIEEFRIFIDGVDFESARALAENEFLNRLGIDEANACRLFVEEIVPDSVPNEHAGERLPLNFCYHEEEP